MRLRSRDRLIWKVIALLEFKRFFKDLYGSLNTYLEPAQTIGLKETVRLWKLIWWDN